MVNCPLCHQPIDISNTALEPIVVGAQFIRLHLRCLPCRSQTGCDRAEVSCRQVDVICPCYVYAIPPGRLPRKGPDDAPPVATEPLGKPAGH